jgi:hypothetical protein
MKIVIEDYVSQKNYDEIENPTAPQVVAYTTCSSLIINGRKYIVECSSLDHDTQTVIIEVDRL